MKSIAITSNHPRHIAFLNAIHEKAHFAKAIIETKLPGSDRFVEREKKFFKECELPANLPTVYCEKGEVNSKRVIEILKSEKPDFIFTFGCSLLQREVIDIPINGCVNIHTGLVQYHRGVDSCYWALYEGRPETIGATVHMINDSIDAGDIIAQERTRNLSSDDNPDIVFFKTCSTGFEVLKENIEDIYRHRAKSIKLKERGKLYQIKDMGAEIKEEIERKTSNILKNIEEL